MSAPSPQDAPRSVSAEEWKWMHWRLVPVEPTEEMKNKSTLSRPLTSALWSAMLAAAPPPPHPAQAESGEVERLRLLREQKARGNADATLVLKCRQLSEALAASQAEVTALRDGLHYNTGTAELAIKHRNEAETALTASLRREDALAGALAGTLGKWVELVESGDAGSWDAEKEPHVIASRAALATHAAKDTP